MYKYVTLNTRKMAIHTPCHWWRHYHGLH